MASKFFKYLFILYFTFFSVSPTFASSISPLTVPTGGQVASGTININQSAPGKLVVNQTTNQGIINWQSFNVGVDAAVHFNTPNASAGTLNNISGGTSTILGSIFSNGRLFFANPSGIIFKPGSQVKAEGLVASAMKISNQDFLSNNFNFTNNQIASLQNEGDLQAQYVALIAPQVSNKGTITTNVATLIAAGDDVKLSISDSNRLSVNINPAKIKTLSSNEGVIKSENGTVSIQANAAQELIDQTINAPRSADSLISENGVIKLVSNSGSIKAKKVNLSSGLLGGTEVAGIIDASSNTKGGDIEITGKEIQIKSNSKLLATGDTGGGNILVGGDWQGSNGVLQATYTTVEKDTLIDASSKGIGDGGKIVVWSDVKNPSSNTIARGTFLALGGVSGGNGGNIETSGSSIDFEGIQVDTKAPKGNTGLWLIDPYNYNINSSSASAIVSALSSSNVTLTTSSNNTSYGSDANILSAGNIIVSSDIVSSSSNQLSLVADGNITIDSPIIISGSGSKIDLNALGGVTLNAKILATNLALVSGQNVTLNSGLGISGTANITANSGLISFGSSFASNATYASSITYNFSSGMDGWTSGIWGSTVNSWTLNDSALYNPNPGSGPIEKSYVMSPVISTNAGSTIRFSSKTTNEGGYYDREHLEYSTNNGVSWTTLIDYNDSAWQYSNTYRHNISAVIPSSSSSARFRFKYDTVDGCCGSPGWWIKNIVVGADISGNLGALNLSSNQVRLNSNVTTSGALTVNAPIQLLGNSQLSSSVASLNQNVDLSSYQLTLNNSSSSSSSGIISGTGSLVKSGLGALTLSGANEYIGNTTVSAGTLSVTGTLGSGTYAGNIANSGTLAMGSNSSQTLSGVVSGTGALTKSGSGTLTLSGTNTYSGATTVSAGTLSVTGTLGSGTYAGNIANSGTLAMGSSSSQTLSGVVSGTGALSKSGLGTLTLSGANTYSGGTTLTAGQISLGANQSSSSTSGALGTGTLTMNGGTLGNTSSYGTIFNNILVNTGVTSTLKETAGSNLYLAGNITGSGTLQVDNTSGWTVALAGDNSGFTGTYIHPSSTVGNTGFYSSTAGSPNASWELSGGRFVNEVSGGNISLGSLSSNASSGYLLGSSGGDKNASYTIGGKNLDSTFTGIIENNYPTASNNVLSITKTGTGTLNLSGTNTYTGATTISAGTLSASSLADTTALSVASGATYKLDQNDTVASIAGAGNINLQDKTLTSAGVSDTTFSGIISGTGTLTKSGSGTLTLSGTNTYSGATTVSAGTLSVTGTLGSGGTYAGNIANSGTLAMGSNSNQTLSGVVSGTGALTKSGGGTLTLSGTNTYSGATTVSAGTLSVTGTLGSGTYAGNIANSGTLAMGSSSSQTLSGVVSGTGALTKSGGGTLTLSGTNTYTGATTISAGTLSASSLADTTALSVASGATYKLDQNDTVASIAGAGNINLQDKTLTSAGASDTTFSGIISGTGGLKLTGSNNLTLSGANTYSGTTHINGGGLVLANSNVLASNSIQSNSGRLKTTERISNLTVTGAVNLIGDIATTGAQTYNNNVTIGAGSAANPLIISSQNSDITFSGTVKTGSGAKAAQRSLTVNAGTGNVTFNDRVGYDFNGITFNPQLTADSPYALSVTGGNITLKGDVMTFETQTYNGAVKIGGNGSNGTTRTLLSMDPKITFNGTVDDTQANTHTLVAKAVQVRSNVLNSDVPEVNFNRPVSSVTKLQGYQGSTGYQIVSNEFGSIDGSASFGSVKLPPSSSSPSSGDSSQSEQRNIERKISSLKTNIAKSSSNTKTGMTLSQMFSSFKPQAGTSFVKSIEIVYPDSPNFGAGKITKTLPADAKSNNTLNQSQPNNQPNQTKPNNNQPNQKQNSSDEINDDDRL